MGPIRLQSSQGRRRQLFAIAESHAPPSRPRLHHLSGQRTNASNVHRAGRNRQHSRFPRNLHTRSVLLQRLGRRCKGGSPHLATVALLKLLDWHGKHTNRQNSFNSSRSSRLSNRSSPSDKRGRRTRDLSLEPENRVQLNVLASPCRLTPGRCRVHSCP